MRRRFSVYLYFPCLYTPALESLEFSAVRVTLKAGHGSPCKQLWEWWNFYCPFWSSSSRSTIQENATKLFLLYHRGLPLLRKTHLNWLNLKWKRSKISFIRSNATREMSHTEQKLLNTLALETLTWILARLGRRPLSWDRCCVMNWPQELKEHFMTNQIEFLL